MFISSTCNYDSHLVSHDHPSWNRLIKQQVLNGNASQAIQSYINMQRLGFSGDNFTFPILLKAVNKASYVCLGLELHGQAIKTGFSDHVYVQTALIKMYSDIGLVENARKVFDKMPLRDLLAWNSMLDGFACNGQMGVAMELFDSMPVKDVSSYNIILSGFKGSKRVESARKVFDKMPQRDTVSWNSIISACTSSGDMSEARALFEQAPRKNIITWNTMIMGYVENKLYAEAVDLFDRMRSENVEPDYLTITGALSACARLRSLETGTKIDVYVRNHGRVSKPHVVTALIDMYAKCGAIEKSLEVFYKSRDKDIYCWNAMISGLALHGHGDSTLRLFEEMRENHLNPDDITFIALLSACSHSGLVREGLELFESMQRDYEIGPKMEHYGCIVDLLSRAEMVERAFEIVEAMPFEPGESILGAMLGACVTQRDLRTGEKVVKLIIGDDKANKNGQLGDGEYMMFSNLYASCGQWEEANRWRSMMNDSGVVKTAGCSEIEVNGRFYKFLAGETSGFF